jgi:hypothetical protein
MHMQNAGTNKKYVPKHRTALVALLVTGILSGVLASLAWGQTANRTSGPQKGAVSLPHLYWHFLVHQNHLLKVAAARKQQGKDGKWLEKYYQRKLAFSDSDFDPINKAAVRLTSKLKGIDDQIKAIVEEEHARHPRLLTSPSELPPVRPELIDLGKQREALLQREMDQLRTALGPEHAAKLDGLLKTDIAPKVSTQHISPPRLHDPAKNHMPPFPKKGVQQ